MHSNEVVAHLHSDGQLGALHRAGTINMMISAQAINFIVLIRNNRDFKIYRVLTKILIIELSVTFQELCYLLILT